MTKKEEKMKALTEYQKTKDIILLQHRLGHKHLKSTFCILGEEPTIMKALDFSGNIARTNPR